LVEIGPVLGTIMCVGLPLAALAAILVLLLLLRSRASKSPHNGAARESIGGTLNPSPAEVRRRIAEAYQARLASGTLRGSLLPNQYRDYIASPAWKARADHARQRAGQRCQLCNKKGQLHVHHRTYERLGRELDGDLIVLCASCHKHFHSTGRAQ